MFRILDLNHKSKDRSNIPAKFSPFILNITHARLVVDLLWEERRTEYNKNMARKHEDTKFRGMWSPKVGSPAGYAFKFLPTAPAQKPKTKANAPPPDPVFEGTLSPHIFIKRMSDDH